MRFDGERKVGDIVRIKGMPLFMLYTVLEVDKVFLLVSDGYRRARLRRDDAILVAGAETRYDSFSREMRRLSN